MLRISTTAARRLAIDAGWLDGRSGLPRGTEGVARVVEHLGRVQIDTIAVVERAHHHILWSRRPDYRAPMLDALQREERRVFEYWWNHTASVLPMADYRFYLPAMRRFAGSPRVRQWLASHSALVDRILGRIREEGPLASADFPDPSGRKRGAWWDWTPAKQGLEMLFRAGALMITARRSFQRLYDLAERVLPSELDLAEPSPQEVGRFVAERCMSTMGLAVSREIQWGRLGEQRLVATALDELVDRGEVIQASVEAVDGPRYVWREAFERVRGRGGRKPRVHILSPFDNLVMDRGRLRELFGFDCKLECYFPAAKRRYGYFCLPILWGSEFVGRMDPKADRKNRTLLVRTLSLERTTVEDALLPALAAELCAFAAFNGCERVAVERAEPPGIRSAIERGANS